MALAFAAGLLVGGVAVYYVASLQINSLRQDLSTLTAHVSSLSGNQTIINQNVTVNQNGTDLSALYQSVRDSVVLIRGTTSSGSVEGSGFVYNFSGLMVIVTNYHVVHQTTSLSVTFADGDGYAAVVNGTDPYADLAVLIVDAPSDKFRPLILVNSSMLEVGDPVIAIGNPYGLVGSMTTGVISALGRTITEEYTGGFGIANIIQTSAPINPGNSGGPLLNYYGGVVGITAAIVADSQGLGFAIPSNAISREIFALVTSGSYGGHSYLGINGTDMTYEVAQDLGVSVTYGWAIVDVRAGGPSDGVLQPDDVIVALNETSIKNGDMLASYLEEHTLPGNTLNISIVRGSQTLERYVVLGVRPLPQL
jgi:S1-C subfamily serine protease